MSTGSSAPAVPVLSVRGLRVEFVTRRGVLAAVDGNKTRAAEILGIDRKTLREKLRDPEPPA